MKKEVPLLTLEVIDRETFEVVGYDNLYETGWSIAGQGGIRRLSSGEQDKDGKTVYDGDILECNDILYRVNYYSGGFWAEVGDESAYLVGETWYRIPYNFGEARVIGNKYKDLEVWEEIGNDKRNSTFLGETQ